MTGSQYNNVVRWTLANGASDNPAGSAAVAKAVFNNCGVAFPSGNNLNILLTLMSDDYMAWRACTLKQARDYANQGTAAVGVDANRVVVVTPDESALSAFEVLSVASSGSDTLAMSADSISPTERTSMQFFAYYALETDPPPASNPQYPLIGAYCSWSGYNPSTWSWSEDSELPRDRRYHLGLDLLGTTDYVHPTMSGTVVAVQTSDVGANGRFVIIEHNFQSETLYSFYAHLASVSVEVDDYVIYYNTIGVVGNSGTASQGIHLHFAITDTLDSGGYDGYDYEFTGNTHVRNGIKFYNPKYIVDNDTIPT